MPPWLAVMLHVPTATKVSVVLLAVQTPCVVDAKLTARPELALADNAAGAVPNIWLLGDVNVML